MGKLSPIEAWGIISHSLSEYYKLRRDKAYVSGREYKGYDDNDLDAEVMCYTALSDLDKRENKIPTAKWIRNDDNHKVYCSNCGYHTEHKTPFCPGCGFRTMKG